MHDAKRLHVVDALRGLAVVLILIIHCTEHFHYLVYPKAETQVAWLNVSDKIFSSVVFQMIAGKAYAIFAFLFGFTFFVQYKRQRELGADFGWRFLWRLACLIPIAYINSLFFPAGDVLMLFVCTGVFLVLVRKWKQKYICLFAILCLMQPVELYHFFSYLIDKNHTLPDWGVSALFKETIAAIKTGDAKTFFLTNLTVGPKASLMWAVGAGRYIQTVGMLLLGFLFAKNDRFSKNKENLKFWIKIIVISALLFAPLYKLKLDWYDNASNSVIRGSIGVVLDMWQKLSFTFVIMSSFVLAYYYANLSSKTKNLEIYGRMSLTNYISHAWFATAILFPIGLGLGDKMGYTYSVLLAIPIYLIQLQFCKWWLKKHKRGPFEELWRKLTWIDKRI